ncbi:Outer membrane usher protein papC Flags: Precursor [Salmonella enterica subsp. diarizonae]|uniref:PapC_1 protein n=1 Tax=Salmonella diarizonae TaxID=59204 RepID=A0A379TWC1_SALDZ|nr:Outer membrane usher protein papC Flags: Precursor [Salmonella enterica subsp. diarizonae]
MKITRLAILITLTFSVLKSQATEFNASLLDSGNLSNVDLTAFSREGYVAPGNYILDIWLNDQTVREQYPVRVCTGCRTRCGRHLCDNRYGGHAGS